LVIRESDRMKTGVARGTIYGAFANGAFLVSGYVIHFWLGRHLGPEDYGIFGVVIGLMTTMNTFLTTGLPLGASKYIAEDNTRLGSIIRNANRIQFILALLLFILYFGLAGFIADLLNDSSLTSYIRISALCLPAYAFFSVYRHGYLNGMKYLDKQAIAFVSHSVLKVGMVFVLVLLGFGVKGAILGYFIATLGAFFVAWKLLGRVQKTNSFFGWQKLLKFGLPATLFFTLSIFAGQVSLFAIKTMGANELQSGYYTSSITVAKLSTVLIGGLVVALFPAISSSIAMNDILQTQSYIRKSMRYVLMLILPMVLLISATSSELLTLVYSSTYQEADTTLSILVFGVGCMAFFGLFSNIIMGSGKPGIALGMIIPMVILEILLNILLVPEYDMEGAAWAHTITGIAGMCAAAVYILRKFKVLISITSFFRVALSSLVIYAIASQISISSSALPFVYAALLALYGLLLLASRELNKKDWQMFKTVLPMERFTGSDDTAP